MVNNYDIYTVCVCVCVCMYMYIQYIYIYIYIYIFFFFFLYIYIVTGVLTVEMEDGSVDCKGEIKTRRHAKTARKLAVKG